MRLFHTNFLLLAVGIEGGPAILYSQCVEGADAESSSKPETANVSHQDLSDAKQLQQNPPELFLDSRPDSTRYGFPLS